MRDVDVLEPEGWWHWEGWRGMLRLVVVVTLDSVECSFLVYEVEMSSGGLVEMKAQVECARVSFRCDVFVG